MKRSLVGILAAVALVGSIGLTGSAASAATTLKSSGSSFANGIMQACKTNVGGVDLTYTSTGSGTGKKNFKAGTFKFAGSDSAVGSSDLPSFGWNYVPYVAGAIAVGYRLDELKGVTLSLSPTSINGIFGGIISKWNDPSIARDLKLNPAWANSKKKSDVKGATALWENTSTTSAKITVSMLPAMARAESPLGPTRSMKSIPGMRWPNGASSAMRDAARGRSSTSMMLWLRAA